MKRAIIYARVSTDDQADNYSIASQITACQRYAEDKCFSVAVVLQDVMSGAKLDRPGLTKVRNLIQQKYADVLIIYCSDRLTRVVAHSLLLHDEFKAAGCTIHFVTKEQNQNMSSSSTSEMIESTFAEYERLKILERMAQGRKTALEKGKVLCGHAPPFGYHYTDRGVISIDEETAAVVHQIYEWYALENLGTPRIINRLSELKIPSPADRRSYNLKPKHKRGQREWCTTTILHILRNTIYKGEYHIKHAGETVVVPVPAIVDTITWEAVAQKRESRKKFSQSGARHMYLLRGRIRCGKCGAACTGTIINGTKAWAQRYYACLRKYHTTIYIGENGRCDLPRFRCDFLEPIIWDWLDREVLNEHHIRKQANLQNDTGIKERQQLEAERANYAKQLASLDEQLSRVIQLYTSGLFQMEEVAAQKGYLDVARASCQKEIKYLDSLIEGMKSITERVDELNHLVQTIRISGGADVPKETKRKIIDLLELEVLLTTADERKYADVACHLIPDHARLLITGEEM